MFVTLVTLFLAIPYARGISLKKNKVEKNKEKKSVAIFLKAVTSVTERL